MTCNVTAVPPEEKWTYGDVDPLDFISVCQKKPFWKAKIRPVSESADDPTWAMTAPNVMNATRNG